MDETSLEDNIPIQKIAEGQPKREKIQTDTKLSHERSCEDGTNAVETALSETPQVLDGLVNEKWFAKLYIVTARRFNRKAGKFQSL